MMLLHNLRFPRLKEAITTLSLVSRKGLSEVILHETLGNESKIKTITTLENFTFRNNICFKNSSVEEAVRIEPLNKYIIMFVWARGY